MNLFKQHKVFETNVFFLSVGILMMVSIGGLVEVVPLFSIESTIEKVSGVRPYSPLEQMGRDIYIREGCYACHSQMIRPFKDETERYGHYSLAAESMYDHPFQWGSKRNGPDLARVGGRYTDDWQVRHLTRPSSVVPQSIMPAYPWLNSPLKYDDVGARLKALKMTGVPYTQEQIDNAKADLETQVRADSPDDAVAKRYPKAHLGAADGNPDTITEMDALVAYLQVLGTFVDFSKVDEQSIRR